MKIDQHTDPMAYQPDMEITSSASMEQVLAARAAYDGGRRETGPASGSPDA